MKLFLDDLRDPPDDSWTVARTANEAKRFIDEGFVREISFDHDLGEELTGNDVAEHVERLAYSNFVDPMSWSVHSANPVGRNNIMNTMNSATRFWNGWNRTRRVQSKTIDNVKLIKTVFVTFNVQDKSITVRETRSPNDHVFFVFYFETVLGNKYGILLYDSIKLCFFSGYVSNTFQMNMLRGTDEELKERLNKLIVRSVDKV